MIMEEYIINRLTECEAENEELRTANRTLFDNFEKLKEEVYAKGNTLLKPQKGEYYMVIDSKVLVLDYDYFFAVDGNAYVVKLGSNPDITRINNTCYFLSKADAEARAKELAEQCKRAES